VVVAEADPDGAAGIEEPQAVEHLDRVIVPVPREDPPFGERRRRVERMLCAHAHGERWRPFVGAIGVGDPDHPDAGDPGDALEETGRQDAFVRRERDEAARVGDVADRGDRAGERLVALGAGLPSIRDLVRHGAQLVRLPTREELAADAEHPLVRAEELVGRGRDDVGAQAMEVDRAVLREVDAVERDERTGGLGSTDQVRGWGDRAHRVRRERERDEPRALAELRVEGVDVERDVVVTDVDPADGRARVARGHDPRPDVRIVVEPCHGDLVAGLERAAERPRQVQQQGRRVLSEQDLVRVAPQEAGAGAARVVDQRVDLTAGRERTVRVGGAGAHPAGDRVDHRVRGLRAAGCVGPDVRPAVRTRPRERGETGADRLHIERRRLGCGHGRSLPHDPARRQGGHSCPPWRALLAHWRSRSPASAVASRLS
jgi:hypothetical protein